MNVRDMTEAQLRREIQEATARIDAAYWDFTRSARGKPPILVVPDQYNRRREAQEEIRRRRRDSLV